MSIIKKIKEWFCQRGWHRWGKMIVTTDPVDGEPFVTTAKLCKWCSAIQFGPFPIPKSRDNVKIKIQRPNK